MLHQLLDLRLFSPYVYLPIEGLQSKQRGSNILNLMEIDHVDWALLLDDKCKQITLGYFNVSPCIFQFNNR